MDLRDDDVAGFDADGYPFEKLIDVLAFLGSRNDFGHEGYKWR